MVESTLLSQMRAPARHRPLHRAKFIEEGSNLQAIAQQATYTGSAEHKKGKSSLAGTPRPRADASICPAHLNDKHLTVLRWLRKAIRSGDVGGVWEQGFPRYVWHKDVQGRVYEARLTNAGSGAYKAYPLHPDQCPDFLLHP